MRKFIGIFITIFMVILCLSSCKTGEVDVPDGLQIVKISEEEGYRFFGPEEWIIANSGDIATSYVAVGGSVKASISFAESEMPEGSLKDYFESQKPLFAYEISIKEEPKITFGNADGECYSVIYTFNYNETDYACLQTFVKNGGSFYIFTYTAEGDPSSEDSYYQKYIEAIRLSAESFKFTEKSSETGGDGYETDADGYKLVSEKDVAGFELYLPKNYSVVSSNASVSAKISDGANIFMSKATNTNVFVLDYLKTRKTELMKFADKVTDIKISLKSEYDPESEVFDGWDEVMAVMPEYDEALVFGNLDDKLIISYEYTYELGGNTYHVYQLLGVKSGLLNTGIGAAGYVFTYTATEDEYAKNLDEIKSILQRMKF